MRVPTFKKVFGLPDDAKQHEPRYRMGGEHAAKPRAIHVEVSSIIEDMICKDYQNGVPTKKIFKKYGITAGTLYGHPGAGKKDGILDRHHILRNRRNQIKKIVKIWEEAFADSVLAILAGEWNGQGLWRGWDIRSLAEIIERHNNGKKI